MKKELKEKYQKDLKYLINEYLSVDLDGYAENVKLLSSKIEKLEDRYNSLEEFVSGLEEDVDLLLRTINYLHPGLIDFKTREVNEELLDEIMEE